MAFLSDPDSFSSFLRQLSAADRDEARQGFERTWRQATIERADDVLQALTCMVHRGVHNSSGSKDAETLALFAATQLKHGLLTWPNVTAEGRSNITQQIQDLMHMKHDKTLGPLFHAPKALRTVVLTVLHLTVLHDSEEYATHVLNRHILPAIAPATPDASTMERSHAHAASVMLQLLLESVTSCVTLGDTAAHGDRYEGLLERVYKALEWHVKHPQALAMDGAVLVAKVICSLATATFQHRLFFLQDQFAPLLEGLATVYIPQALAMFRSEDDAQHAAAVDILQALRETLVMYGRALSGEPVICLAKALSDAMAHGPTRQHGGPVILDVLVRLREPTRSDQLLPLQLKVLVLCCIDHPLADPEALREWAAEPFDLGSMFDAFDVSTEQRASMSVERDTESLAELAILKLQELLDDQTSLRECARELMNCIKFLPSILEPVRASMPAWLPAWIRGVFLGIGMERCGGLIPQLDKAFLPKHLASIMDGPKWNDLHPMQLHGYLTFIAALCLYAPKDVLLVLPFGKLQDLLMTCIVFAHHPSLPGRTQALALRAIWYLIRSASHSTLSSLVLVFQRMKRDLVSHILNFLENRERHPVHLHIAVDVLRGLAQLDVLNGDEERLAAILTALRTILQATWPAKTFEIKLLRKAIIRAVGAIVKAAAEDLPPSIVHGFMGHFTAQPLAAYDRDDPQVEVLLAAGTEIIIAMDAPEFDKYLEVFVPFVMDVLVRCLRANLAPPVVVADQSAGGVGTLTVAAASNNSSNGGQHVLHADGTCTGTAVTAAGTAQVQFQYRDVYLSTYSTDTVLRLCHNLGERLLPYIPRIVNPLNDLNDDAVGPAGSRSGSLTVMITRLQFMAALVGCFPDMQVHAMPPPMATQFKSLLGSTLSLGTNLVHVEGISSYSTGAVLSEVEDTLRIALSHGAPLPPLTLKGLEGFGELRKRLVDKLLAEVATVKRKYGGTACYQEQLMHVLHSDSTASALTRLLNVYSVLVMYLPDKFLGAATRVVGELLEQDDALFNVAAQFATALLTVVGTSSTFRSRVHKDDMSRWRTFLHDVVHRAALRAVQAMVSRLKSLPTGLRAGSPSTVMEWMQHVAAVELLTWLCVLPEPATGVTAGGSFHREVLSAMIQLLKMLGDVPDESAKSDKAASPEEKQSEPDTQEPDGRGRSLTNLDAVQSTQCVIMAITILMTGLQHIPPAILHDSLDWPAILELMPLMNPQDADYRDRLVLAESTLEDELEEAEVDREITKTHKELQTFTVRGLTAALRHQSESLFGREAVYSAAVYRVMARYMLELAELRDWQARGDDGDGDGNDGEDGNREEKEDDGSEHMDRRTLQYLDALEDLEDLVRMILQTPPPRWAEFLETTEDEEEIDTLKDYCP